MYLYYCSHHSENGHEWPTQVGGHYVMKLHS